MFQIAAIEYLAYKNNTTVGYFNWESQLKKIDDDIRHNPSIKHASEYNNIFKNLSFPPTLPPKSYANVPFHYIDLPFQEETCYNGFFQSEKYFPDKEFITNLFSPSKFVIDQLSKYNDLLTQGTTCAIHVRRGDYLKFSHVHFLQPLDYYKKGIETIKADYYLFFSDDLQWCKENFKGSNYYFIEDKDYVELFLMTKCDHNIISNSSFSWWGAWLNENKNKVVIGPNKWFGSAINHGTSDVIPESWIKI